MDKLRTKTFELILMDLSAVLRKPGCPICRVTRQSEETYIQYLMWESTDSFEYRRLKLEPLSYCPQHAHQITALEYSLFNNVKSTNLMYESLAGEIETRLSNWQNHPLPDSLWSRLLRFTGKWFPYRVPTISLSNHAPCPICEDADKSSRYCLDALVEGLETGHESLRNLYAVSDGLCLNHLCLAFQHYTQSHGRKPEFLNLDAQKRLKHWRQAMRGYDHKHRWENIHEHVSPEEERACRQMLAFVTGLEPEF